MFQKYSTLLKCVLLFLVYIALSVVLVIALHFLLPALDPSDLMLVALDFSFLLCFIVGVSYFKSKPVKVKSNLWFIPLYVLFAVIWYIYSPYFTFYNKQWSTNLHFSIKNWTNITQEPTFFKSYRFFRVLLWVPILEELFYRKIIFSKLLEKYNVYIAMLFSSLLFSLGHLDLDNIFVFFIYGIFLGLVYYKFRHIYYSISLHIFINFLTLFFL